MNRSELTIENDPSPQNILPQNSIPDENKLLREGSFIGEQAFLRSWNNSNR